MDSHPDGLRITSATIFEVTYVLTSPYKLSYGTLKEIDALILKLTDENGNIGWGEANPQVGFTDESLEDIVNELKQEILPVLMDLRSLDPEMVDRMLDERKPGHLMAKGSVTMALLDLKGQRSGRPLAELLGPVQNRSLPVLWPLSNGCASDDIQIVDSKLKEGYRSFMLKMGSAGSRIGDEIERVATLRNKYGDTVKFIPDANTGWTRQQTLEFMHGVRETDVVFLEQPLPKDDIEGMADLSQHSRIPLSLDESVTSFDNASRIIELGAAKVFSIKSSKNGGPLRARALSDLAAQHGVKIYFNSMLEGGITQAASLHHAATVSNLVDAGHAFMSTKRLENDPTNFSDFVKDGTVSLPTGVGLGISVDEEKVRAMSNKVHQI